MEDFVPRRKLHRTVFVLAGLYNVSWGAFTALDPGWLFRYAGMPLMQHPAVLQTLAMVVGLYGLLYLEVARRPEDGWMVAAVGLLGKFLGPLGFAWLVLTGQWPLRAGILILTNDLVWWAPFMLYLYDSWPFYSRTNRNA